jgi:mono/diheme cytochrome c family protein
MNSTTIRCREFAEDVSLLTCVRMCGGEPTRNLMACSDVETASQAPVRPAAGNPINQQERSAMRNTQIVAAATALALLAAAPLSHAADAAAGQKTFDSVCTTCHQLKDKYYAGKSEATLETTLKGIVAGKIKHGKPLTLSDTDITNVATYISDSNAK